MRSMIIPLLLSILPVCWTVTVFPYRPPQWDGGFSANITLRTDADLCGWKIKINFNNTVVGLTPYNIRLAGSVRANTNVYRVKEHTYNYQKSAGEEFNLEFNGELESGVAVSIISAVIVKTTRGSYVCSHQTTKAQTTQSPTTAAPTTQAQTTQAETTTQVQTTTDVGSQFPMVITDQWNTGFNAMPCLTAPVDICGWEVKIEFSDTVSSINGYNCKLPYAQSNTNTYYIVSESWKESKSVSAGSQLCPNFGATKSSDVTISIVNMVITETQLDAGTCDHSQTTVATTAAQTTSNPDTTQNQETTTSNTETTQNQETTTANQETTTGAGMTTDATTDETTSSSSNGYLQALSKSILFYEAQRSGDLPDSNRIDWRGDSCLNDISVTGRDLTGGWYDAGDNVKFNFPMAWSTTVLAWGLIQFKEGYVAAGELDNMYDSIRWPLDYLLKCWDDENEIYWAQVGDGVEDHSYWSRPELITYGRPSYQLNVTHPGSDVTAETAAAFAAASMVFATEDSAYSSTLLDKAKSLFDFAYNYRATYHTNIPAAASFYKSHSGYNDELCWAAAWLYKVTGETAYKDKANEFINNYSSEFSWDNKIIGCHVLMYEIEGTADIQTNIESFMTHWMNSVSTTPTCDLRWHVQWGPLRYSANAAFIGLVAADLGLNTDQYREWSLSQIDYMLGANEQDRSYVVGFGINPPVKPHHRSSSCNPDFTVACSWEAYNSLDPNPSTLNGALVGGPNQNGDYTDARSDYIANEVACDYNAGFQSSLAALGKLSNEGNFPDHTNPCCDASLDFCEV